MHHQAVSPIHGLDADMVWRVLTNQNLLTVVLGDQSHLPWTGALAAEILFYVFSHVARGRNESRDLWNSAREIIFLSMF